MPLMRGKAFYAKVCGQPRPGYDKTKLEWSMDFCVSPENRKELVKMGVKDYIKNKGDDRGDFITFKRASVKKDGGAAKPIRIVDNKGNMWDQGTLIGNGSVVNVNFALNERADGKLKPSLIALQVWELVPYEGKASDEDFPIADSEEVEEDWSSESEAA